MMNENEFFAKVNNLVGSLTPRKLANMLESSEVIIGHLMKTRYYKQIENDISSGHFGLDLLVTFAHRTNIDPQKASIVVWMSGFAAAIKDRDPEQMLFQLATFLAAQKANIFRIEDDKARLVITHIHCNALGKLIEEGMDK